jgi:hypothetical protein
MAKWSEASPAACDHAELRQEMARLREQMQVLTDVLEEIRQELQWLTRNGLPAPEPSTVPVLKSMALDPTAPNWNAHLRIERGSGAAQKTASPASTMPIVAKPPPGQVTLKPGDQGRLF